MGSEEKIVDDLTDRQDPRKVFEVPLILIGQDWDLEMLLGLVRTKGVGNQLGYLVDICVDRKLCPDDISSRRVVALRDTLYSERTVQDIPFYASQEPETFEYKRKRRSVLAQKWSLLAVFDEEKCERVVRDEYSFRKR